MGNASFREIAAQLDPLYPPVSLRDLLKRFRYTDIPPGSLPAPPHSFREIARRMDSSSHRTIQFLHYNTWLMKVPIDISKFIAEGIGGIPQLLHCIGASYLDLALKVVQWLGSSQVCDTLFPPIVSICGVSVNPLNDACKLIGDVADLVAWILDKLDVGVDWLLDVLNVPGEILLQFALDLVGFNQTFWIKEKPQLMDRTVEIGTRVFSYDLVSLTEVWYPDSQSLLLGQGPQVPVFGPTSPGIGDWHSAGSGLLVFSPSLTAEDGGQHTYGTAGVQRITPGGCDFGAFVDADLWAMKGVQLTRVNVGWGTIDLYSTHLYSGGDMPDLGLGLPAPTSDEKAEVRKAQVAELADFISLTHDPRNVALIAGDFNIPAGAEYDNLRNGLSMVVSRFPNHEGQIITFDDWWAVDTFHSPANGFPSQSQTNRSEDVDSFDPVCKAFQGRSPLPSDYYCDERVPSDAGASGDRIDYILVERPTATHSFMLDVSRIRRRAFRRPQATAPQYFLSDHLGLEVTLFASSRV